MEIESTSGFFHSLWGQFGDVSILIKHLTKGRIPVCTFGVIVDELGDAIGGDFVDSCTVCNVFKLLAEVDAEPDALPKPLVTLAVNDVPGLARRVSIPRENALAREPSGLAGGS